MTMLSINHYIAPAGYPLAKFLDEAAAAGAGSVGLSERALSEADLSSLKRMLRERGLGVTSVNSAGFFLWADPERVQQQLSINATLLEAAAELSADTLVVIGGGLHDMGPQDVVSTLARARNTFEAELPALIEAAGRYGVRLGIEPMHPLRIFTKGTLNTLSQTAALCDRFPGLGVVLDLFHSWWEPELETALARLADRLTLVQLWSDSAKATGRAAKTLRHARRRCGYPRHLSPPTEERLSGTLRVRIVCARSRRPKRQRRHQAGDGGFLPFELGRRTEDYRCRASRGLINVLCEQKRMTKLDEHSCLF
jgi:sugar phosphate isomerase/epimerase